jgi:hypothetical protein
MILVNKTAFTAMPTYYGIYRFRFDFAYHTPIINDIFVSAGPNLGITSNFSSFQGYDGTCFAGVWGFRLKENTAMKVSLNFTTDSVTIDVLLENNSTPYFT